MRNRFLANHYVKGTDRMEFRFFESKLAFPTVGLNARVKVGAHYYTLRNVGEPIQMGDVTFHFIQTLCAMGIGNSACDMFGVPLRGDEVGGQLLDISDWEADPNWTEIPNPFQA